MRILVDVRLLARGGASGIAEYARHLLNHLFSQDRENEYVLFYNGLRAQAPLSSFFPNHRARVINWRVPNKLLDAAGRIVGWPAADKILHPDLVFSPHVTYLRIAEAPRVTVFHDLSFIHHPQFFGARQRFWHWLQDIAREARRARLIIANSDFTRRDLIETLGIPEETILRIYPGVAENLRPLPEDDPALRRFLLRRGIAGPYLLYLGTLEPRKNVQGIIRAFNLFKTATARRDFSLVLAGKPGWLYRDIIREAKQSPFRNAIKFLGQVEDAEKQYLYCGARAFLYPSFFEGFGFPPLEAQSSGCPVIVSSRTSLPEVTGDAALFVNPWRTMELAEAMDTLSEPGALRETLVRNGLRNSRRFSWNDAAAATLKAFSSLCDE